MSTSFANSSVFVDQVLPERLFGTWYISFKRGGEYELLCAILEDAICCFQRGFKDGKKRTQRLAHEAEEWLFTNDPTWPMSFVNVCAVLGIDAENLRNGLRHRQQQYLHGVLLQQRRKPLRSCATYHLRRSPVSARHDLTREYRRERYRPLPSETAL